MNVERTLAQKVRSAKETGSCVGGIAEASGTEANNAAAAAARTVSSFILEYLLGSQSAVGAYPTVAPILEKIQPCPRRARAVWLAVRASTGSLVHRRARLSIVVSTSRFKNGMHVEVDGTVFKIVEFQHVKPGKGGAFVRTKLKRVEDGAVIDKTFRAGEKFRPVRTESRRMQFLYSDGADAHFMDVRNYEQLAVPEDQVRESLKWVVPNEEVDVLYVDESPTDVQVPTAVELTVAETDPGLRGDTASGGGDKPATLESGVVVRVPLFVNTGDKVRVDTRSGEYVSRA